MFVDIHCHILPDIDDGSTDLEMSIEMARMAVAEGITTVIVTPHQLDRYRANSAAKIREATHNLQLELTSRNLPLTLLPGGDVRIESDFIARIKDDSIMTLADRKRHVLLELPHELYYPIDPLLRQLQSIGIVGILSHPERNAGLMREPKIIEQLVQAGCLMQVTAGSINGSFGVECERLSHSLIKNGLVHFVATDAHGIVRRRPVLKSAYQKSIKLVGEPMTERIFCTNPQLVASGADVKPGKFAGQHGSKRKGWFHSRKKRAGV